MPVIYRWAFAVAPALCRLAPPGSTVKSVALERAPSENMAHGASGSVASFVIISNAGVTRRPAKGGHVLLFEVLSSVRQALALYGKMSGFPLSH